MSIYLKEAMYGADDVCPAAMCIISTFVMPPGTFGRMLLDLKSESGEEDVSMGLG